MTATLWLGPLERVSRDEAVALLHAAGVRTGHLAAALARLAHEGGPLRVVVARGVSVVPPRDAEVSYTFGDALPRLAPARDAEGRSYYPDLALSPGCVEGQVLARRQPPRKGRCGRTVTGQPLAPRSPLDAPVRAGRGAHVSPDGHTVIADIPGRPHREGSVVLVRRVSHLVASAEPGAQRLDVDGDLVVSGDLGPQVVLCVTGDVTITGQVRGAKVVAGGMLRVAGGVSACACLVAGRGVGVDALEESSVRCGGDLVVRGDLVRCEVEAGGDACIGGGLREGVVRVAGRLEARTIGSAQGGSTQVAVGTICAVSEEQRALRDERLLLRQQQGLLARRAQSSPAAGAPEASVSLQARDQALVARCGQLSRAWVPAAPAIVVQEQIHPGVRLQIGEAALEVADLLGPGALSVVEGVIRLLL